MKIENFSYLLEIQRYGSISVASERLHLTRQALSAIIRSLEHELGVVLLERTNTGVSLTEHGKEVCETAKKILWELKTSKKQLAGELGAEVKGTLILHTDKLTSLKVLPKLLAEFSIKYPNITLVTDIVPAQDYFKNTHLESNDIYLFTYHSNEVEGKEELPLGINSKIFRRNELLIGLHSNHIDEPLNQFSKGLQGKKAIINAEEFDESLWLKRVLSQRGLEKIDFISNALVYKDLVKEFAILTVELNTDIQILELKDIAFFPFDDPIMVDSYYYTSENANVVVEVFIKELSKSYNPN
ncbi:MAG: LysR family transcriptional regulator [Desulfitobacterium sp.]